MDVSRELLRIHVEDSEKQGSPYVLGVNRGYGSMLYRDYVGIESSYSLD